MLVGTCGQVPVVVVRVLAPRSVPETAGATVLTGTPNGVEVPIRRADWLPAGSLPAPRTSVGISVPAGAPPAVALASVKTYGPAPEPVTEETVQPVLVPPSVSFAAVTPVTASEKLAVYVAAARVLDVSASEVTVGATVSTVAVADSVIVGPVSVSASVTASTASATVTAPWEPVAPVGATDSVYGPLPEPVTPVIPQPAAPPSEKSPVVSPATGSVNESVNVIAAEAEATLAAVGAKLATTGRDLE